MKNLTILVIVIIIVFLAGGFVFTNSEGTTGNVVAQNPKKDATVLGGDNQQVVLKQEGFNYKDINAKSGKPIKIRADSSVKGCLRAPFFNIDGKKYYNYLRTSEDILQLPALKKGIYSFSCSMGMGYGKLIIE
ncbi:cupredoxin domain-containing protein [Candidatus Woesearchaeota archaeon]|nr:cupredoxin domain-containing protein [Candidatus Woesearchaeota archaeon]